MVPTRKITEIKVKFSGISEIYPTLCVSNILGTSRQKGKFKERGERMVAKPIP